MESGQNSIKQELKKIEELHQRDMKASKAGDYKTLQSLLTGDAVMMPPNESWIRGADRLEKNYRHMEEAMSSIEILDYKLDFEEVNVTGDYAYEWGMIRGTSRDKDGKVERTSYKVMRILKKIKNGEWKVHRAIWNRNPTE